MKNTRVLSRKRLRPDDAGTGDFRINLDRRTIDHTKSARTEWITVAERRRGFLRRANAI